MIRLQNIDANIKPSRTFGRGKYLIGRSPSCDLEIPDRTMSRQHAMLEVVDDERIYLTDLDSRNGTMVNGERIMNTVRLKPDDVVSFGEVSFHVSPVDDDTFRGDTVPVGGQSGAHATMEVGVDTGKIPVASQEQVLVDALEFLGRVQVDPGDAERVYADLLKGVRLAMDCEEAAIHLVDTGSAEITRSFTSGQGTVTGTAALPIAKNVIASVIESAPVIRVAANPGGKDDPGERMLLVARLDNNDGDALGLLCIRRSAVDKQDPGQVFNDLDDRTISSVVHVVASKIANLQFLQRRG